MARKLTANMLSTLDGVVRFEAVHAGILGLHDEQFEAPFASKIAKEDASRSASEVPGRLPKSAPLS